MSIKTFVVAAAVAVGTFAFADRADAQYRRGAVYASPYVGRVYSSNGIYSNGIYSSNRVYANGVYANGVVQSGYSPYRNSYYSPYTSNYYSPYNNAYYNGNAGLYSGYNGYSNILNTPNISIGTSGVIIGGVR